MRFYKFLNIFLIFFSTIVLADDVTFSVVEQRDLPQQIGIYRELKFPNEDIELYVAILDHNYRARLYQQAEKNQLFGKSLKELHQNENFLLGINGGYYMQNYQPVGLFIAEGKTYQNLKKSRLITSCVGINNDNKLYLAKDRQDCLQGYYAMQIGPWLIDQGEINPNIKKYEDKPGYLESFFNKNRRTVLAKTNGDKKLLVIVTPSATLLEIAKLLKNYPQAFGVNKVMTAINLDGGSSTGMYIGFKDDPFYYPELKPVKTFVFFSE